MQTRETYATDVLVVGASIGGLVAAIRCLENGAATMLLEAGRETGGTAVACSAGVIHMFNLAHWEQVKSFAPGAAQGTLARKFAETWPIASDYIRRHIKAPHTAPPLVLQSILQSAGMERVGSSEYAGLDFGMGPLEDSSQYESKRAFCDHLDSKIESLGGEILLGASVTELSRDSDGRALKCRAVTSDGGSVTVLANSVLLSCGGFQANPEMMVRYLGPWANKAVCRAVPYNTGAGLMMAVGMGARLTAAMDSTYGHQQAALPYVVPTSYSNIGNIEEYERYDRTLLNRLYSIIVSHDSAGLDVDLTGARFADEGQQFSNIVNESVLNRPHGLAVRIFDSQNVTDRMRSFQQVLTDNGGTLIQGESLESLVDAWNARNGDTYRMDGSRLLDTVEEFNAAARTGEWRKLSPPRTGHFIPPLEKPPFHLIPWTAGFSMTYGGVEIDEACRVIGSGRPVIPGLYAIPGTAGGVMYKNYLGSLACQVSFGYISGTTASEFARRRNS